MKHFSRFPVLRTLFPFVSGIISADLMELNPAPLLITTIIFGMLSLMFTINHYATGKYASRWLAGFPFFMMFFSMGFALNQFGYRKPDLMSYNFINRELTLLLKLEQPPLRSASGSRFSGKVVALGDSLNWNSVSFKSMIRTRQVPEKLSLYRGDWILVRGWLREVPAPLNPGAFNYQKFLARKGIYFQLFADSLKIEQVHSPQPERSLFWYADEVRNYLLGIIERRYPDPQIRGVAGALLLGYEDWMEPDVEAGFAAAGVLHILCVSGMHVGLIYMILSWTLNKILRRKWTAFMKYPLLIFCIWFYAMVTGFAPSVVRASAMLTVVILGRWTDRNSDITNLLGVSCMVLMIFEPALLFSAGFQLSFLAVCGIVYLSKPIASVWQSKSTLFLKMRDLTAISIAAQLATFPIALLLFHQFPNYFLLANLVVVPLSTAIMYVGLLQLTLENIPLISDSLTLITHHAIWLMNYIIHQIGELPGAVTEEVRINLIETIGIYLMIITISVWLRTRNAKWLTITLCLLALFMGRRIASGIIADEQNIFTWYHSRETPVLSWINGRHVTVVQICTAGGSEMDSENSQLVKRYTWGPHLLQENISSFKVKNCIITDSTARLLGNVFIVGDWSKGMKPSGQDLMQVKTLILLKSVHVDANTILRFIKPSTVVLDSSLPGWQRKRLKEGFTSLGIYVHSVPESGAYQAKMNLD